jgi:hypothetical protein
LLLAANFFASGVAVASFGAEGAVGAELAAVVGFDDVDAEVVPALRSGVDWAAVAPVELVPLGVSAPVRPAESEHPRALAAIDRDNRAIVFMGGGAYTLSARVGPSRRSVR